MKRDILILAVAVMLGGVSVLRSQTTAANPVEMLKTLKSKNAELIEKQKKRLDSLDEMAKEADQIRILAKRT
jgi:hypothetical protein